MSKAVASLRSLAYNFACSVVETNCVAVDGDLSGWYDICDVNPHAAGDLADALLYLELRGLLERDPANLNHVSVREESEDFSSYDRDNHLDPDNH